MNKINILSAVLIMLLLTGCASTYTVKNFPSKEEFYRDFNISTHDKSVHITLTNDSSFVSSGGTKITDDSVCVTQILPAGQRLGSNDIVSINYFDNNLSTPFAKVYLKNKEAINANIFAYLADSSVVIHPAIVENIPLIRIKEMHYTNSWLGIPIRLLIGAAAGFVIGVFTGATYNDNTQAGSDKQSYFYIYGAPVGALIGSIVGLIVGYDFTYIFNR